MGRHKKYHMGPRLAPQCRDCKWFNPKTRMCSVLSWTPKKPMLFRAELVRENVDLCGPEGLYFDTISVPELHVFKNEKP